VSRVAKTLGAAEIFHRRPLKGAYRTLTFDGVVLSCKNRLRPGSSNLSAAFKNMSSSEGSKGLLASSSAEIALW
jgi:hypothetical protein